jgi:hypothetical protein
MSAKRINITIADEDKRWLDAYTQINKISLAEAVCQGIDLLKKGQRQKAYQKLVERTCGIWMKGDSLAYQEKKMRTEWE